MPTCTSYTPISGQTSQEVPEEGEFGRIAPGVNAPWAQHAGAQRPGLVYSQTTPTGGCADHILAIDPKLKRVKRCRYSTITAARLLDQEARRGGFRVQPWFVTLTYRPGVEWEAGHLSKAIEACAAYFKRCGVRVSEVWAAEMQKRGAVHYHLVYWLPKGRTMPKWDKRGWWPHGMTQVVKARNAVGYIAKYVSKGEDKPFPKGCRTYGCGGLTQAGRRIAAWWKLPTFVRDRWGSEHRPKRMPGGVWVSRLTGETVVSEWGFAGFSRGCVLLRRRTELERRRQLDEPIRRAWERVRDYTEDVYEQGKAVLSRFTRLEDDQLAWLALADKVVEGRF